LTADVAPSWRRSDRCEGRARPRIERIVDKQLGPGAPAAVRETVRTALERAVADDPVLSEKIRSLATLTSATQLRRRRFGAGRRRSLRFAARASRTCGGRKTASVSKPASASISIATRSAGGIAIDDHHHAPLTLHSPRRPRRRPSSCRSGPERRAAWRLLQRFRHLFGFHQCGRPRCCRSVYAYRFPSPRPSFPAPASNGPGRGSAHRHVAFRLVTRQAASLRTIAAMRSASSRSSSRRRRGVRGPSLRSNTCA